MHLHTWSLFRSVPHVAGGGRIAELRFCAGYQSGMAQGHPGGGAAVQRQWAGRCVATGMGTAMW